MNDTIVSISISEIKNNPLGKDGFYQTKQLYSKWDKFVDDHEFGTMFHKNLWREIQSSNFQFKDLSFAILTDKNEIVGGVPLMRIKSISGQSSLCSVPSSIGGGILAINKDVKEQIVQYLKKTYKGEYIEFRDLYLQNETERLLKKRHPTHAFFSMELPTQGEDLLLSIPRKTRAEIRKGLKLIENGKLSIVNKIDVNAFYNLYAYNLWSKGTPIASKKYFSDLIEKYKDKIEMFFILNEQGKSVSVILSFLYNDHYLPYFMGYNKDARKLHAIEQALYQTMLNAIKLKMKHYDFGRSQINSGSYHFKRHFGIEPSVITYEYLGPDEFAKSPYENKKLKILSKTWSILPLWLSKIIGPMVFKYFV